MRKEPLPYDARRWPKERRRSRKRASSGRPRLTRGVAMHYVFIAQDQFTTSTGLEVTHAQQYYRGLRVYRSTRVITRDKNRVQATPVQRDLPDVTSLKPRHSAVDALKVAVAFLEKRHVVSAPFDVEVVRQYRAGHSVDQPTFLEVKAGFREAVPLHLEVFPESPDRVRLVWVMDLVLADDRQFHAVVSADGRRPLVRLMAQTNSCAFQGSWFLGAPPSIPSSCPLPLLTRPQGSSATASTWDNGSGQAAGPNAICRAGSSSQLEALGSAEVDNAFIWCNRLHDLFAAFGFTANRFALEGDDPLIIRRFPGADAKVAEYDNAIDGLKSTMRLWGSGHAGGAHAAADPSIVIHEYVHGVSSRLVGGSTIAKPFLTRESKGVSEGISDYFALTVLNFARRANAVAGIEVNIGARYQPNGGIRQYGSPNSITFDPKWKKDASKMYDIGRALCAGLLDARTAIATLSSEDDADRFIWQAWIDALMALQPTDPNFEVTLGTAKAALLVAAQRIEDVSPGLAGATTEIDTALTARNI